MSAQEFSSTRSAVMRSRCGCDLNIEDVVQRRQKTQALWITMSLLFGFFVAELVTGLWSHSLSLLADAVHLVSDIAALALSLLATWLAQRPATGQATFAYRRVEILAALVNGIGLLALAGFIAWEAVARFQAPEPVLGLIMLVGAGIGLIVNSLNISLLHQHSHNDLNLRGAFLHVVADAISSVGVILAALAIYFLNWLWLDAIASLLVASLTGLSAVPLVKESLEVLMEYAPRSIETDQVKATLESFPGIHHVEKLYIWTITSGQVMLCAHLLVESLSVQERDQLLKQLQAHLNQEFGITESILQLIGRDYRDPSLHPLFSSDLASLLSNRHNTST